MPGPLTIAKNTVWPVTILIDGETALCHADNDVVLRHRRLCLLFDNLDCERPFTIHAIAKGGQHIVGIDSCSHETLRVTIGPPQCTAIKWVKHGIHLSCCI